MIAMSQNNKLERDLIYKRSIVLVYLFPHTCTSWSKSLALLSLDSQFDFTTNVMQVHCFVYPYLKLHINLLEVGENKRRQNFAMPWWGNIHHWVIWECHLRSIKWTIVLFEKNFKKTPSAKMLNWEDDFISRAVPLLNNTRKHVSQCHKPQLCKECVGITFV
jgi:hypothetical protein